MTDNSTFSQLSTPANHLLHPYSEDTSCCDDIEILNIVRVGERAWLHNQSLDFFTGKGRERLLKNAP